MRSRRRPPCGVFLGLTTLAACAALLLVPTVARAQTCPAPATVVVVAANLSADASVVLNVEGELRDAAGTCSGTGAVSYATTLTCNGTGAVRCGTITGLRPGAWINRVTLTVAGSASQTQAQQAVFLGDAADAVSNVLTWTVYPATFIVESVSEADLRATLDDAQAYTATHAGPALVSFAGAAFPGASAPQTIDVAKRIVCSPDGRKAALCLTGSRVVIDALDATAEPGAVIWTAGARATALLRVYGSDNVLRGLVFQGSTLADLPTQADTVTFTGAAAQRNRLEHSLVHGPTNGDAVSGAAGAGPPAAANVVDDCELTGAEDRGLKVTTSAYTTIRRSCVHDNHNGGVQSTLGGHVVALDNLIQHNVPGPSDNGFSAGTGGDSGERSTLTAAGNIVRFSGARGVSVVDDADVVLSDDYVADNQFTGARVETLALGAPTATAVMTGVAFVCNRQSDISGTCSPQPATGQTFCTIDADCCASASGCCVLDPGCVAPPRCAAATPLGFGAVVAACDGCAPPALTLGTSGAPGGNALTLNANVFPMGQGTNLSVSIPGLALAARGNQWEHCGVDATCDTAAVAAADVQLAAGASADVAAAVAARAGVPAPTALSVGRPRKGDLVRVFGAGFNAIDGADCAQATAPVAPCSAENPRVAQQNRSQRNGNQLRLTIAGQAPPIAIDVDAVTPTMLAFRMPVDCFAPAILEVSKRDNSDVRVIGTIPFCDAGGCLDQDDGVPCDDHDACTTTDACVAGTCTSGPSADCDDHNPCTDDSCDPVLGCLHTFNTAGCDDGDACTSPDVCSGGTCQGGPPLVCGISQSCDSRTGCVPGVQPDCRRPTLPKRAPLAVRDQSDDRRDGLTWQWTAGAATTKADFGNPLTTTDYMFSIFDGSGARPYLHAHIPAGGLCGTRTPKPCWKETKTGFRYDNRALEPDGILRVVLQAGAAGKARVGVQGRGPLLALRALPLVRAVTAQLVRADGACWDAAYDLSISKSDTHTFKARGD